MLELYRNKITERFPRIVNIFNYSFQSAVLFTSQCTIFGRYVCVFYPEDGDQDDIAEDWRC